MTGYELNQPYQHGTVDSTVNRLIRYHIPLAEVITDEDRTSFVVLEAGCIFTLKSEEYGDQAFITELSECQPLKLKAVMSTWQYHERNLAQDILPFLFLGPMAAARNPAFVQDNQFTMLLAVRDGQAAAINPKIMDPARFASANGIETGTFDIFNEYDLIRRFRSVIKQMNNHLMVHTTTRPVTQLSNVCGKILVFCEAGDRRSPALVALYLMVVFGLSANSAIQAIQARRYGININGELLRLLQNCGDILQAEREACAAVDTNSIISTPTTKQSRKRSIQVVLDEDEAMDTAPDTGGSFHRAGVAPFKNSET